MKIEEYLFGAWVAATDLVLEAGRKTGIFVALQSDT